MAKPKIINRFGTLIGWNNITINVLGREMEGVDEIEYTDEEDVNVAHGAGKYPIGKTAGNYTAKASVNLYAEEVIALQKQLPKGTRIQQIPDFDVIVQYEYNGQLYKDVIRNASFKNNGRNVKNNEGKIVTKFDLVVTHIDWNV